MTVRLRVIASAVVMLMLVACSGRYVKPVASTAAMLARQVAREQRVAAYTAWSLSGRLGVSDGRDGGSGSVEWIQDGAEFHFSVHAPVTGKTWILSGDVAHAVLRGLRDAPIEGASATALLQRELGWRVPVRELAYWVRAMRAPGKADIEFQPDGLPAAIGQAGWKVEYSDYRKTGGLILPGKVFASMGSYKVRLAIRKWTLQ